LAEKGDLAGGTSSASTKLIHGGLRYLEQYEFRLVRDALKEREVLLGMAPHIIRPMRFVLPHHGGLRPAYLIRLGLWLYDHLGGRQILAPSRPLDLTRAAAGKPLKPKFTRGFEYSDCWVDDARLVVLNAMDAAARGAEIRVRTEVTAARRQGDHWQVELSSAGSSRLETVTARALVNAAGAWAGLAARCIASSPPPRIRLVKGSHIVVPKLFDHEDAYIFQNADRRIVFAIPYEQHYTLIGTTDVDFAGDLSNITISPEEADYLCAAVGAYFAAPVLPSDIVWSYAGVRSLHDDGEVSAQEATRDFEIELDGRSDAPPLLTIVGGKITTYRHLAEEVLKKLAATFPQARLPWTRGASLPGGDFRFDQRDELERELAASAPTLDAATTTRLVGTYGTMARSMFAGAATVGDLGIHFGAGLYEREVVHLVDNEWARTADDILWRRTKLGLRIGGAERQRLAEWLDARASR
jgi:glycerol-3-phosphate dehydrogenase